MTNRMALRHIEAFNSVIRMGTMTGAAVALHTSQPQISRLIGQLEAIVQFKLFERNGSRLKPTLEGLRFHNEVRKTFDGLTTLEAAATNIRAFGTQRLSVAAMPRLAGGPMARAVASFKLAHPRVLVAIHSGDAQAVHRWVHSGFCDAGLAMLYDEEADAQDLQVEVLHRANFVVVLPPGHPLTQRRVVHARDLDGHSLVAAAQGSSLRQRCDRLLAEAGASCTITAEANLGSTVCALVAAGIGIGLINPLAAQDELRDARLEMRPFLPETSMSVALLYPTQVEQHRLVQTFAGSARGALLREFASLPGTAAAAPGGGA